MQVITVNSAVIDELDMAADEAFRRDRQDDPPRSKSNAHDCHSANAVSTRW
jgi:hypothetical protein